MGGRGGASRLAQKETTLSERIKKAKQEAEAYSESQRKEKATKSAKKDTARQAGIVSYISEQTGVNLNKYRDDTTRKYDKRDGINIDWNNVPNGDRQKILDLANRYGGGRYSVEDNGAWMKFIRIKKGK